jgi:hypothetical protein
MNGAPPRTVYVAMIDADGNGTAYYLVDHIADKAMAALAPIVGELPDAASPLARGGRPE